MVSKQAQVMSPAQETAPGHISQEDRSIFQKDFGRNVAFELLSEGCTVGLDLQWDSASEWGSTLPEKGQLVGTSVHKTSSRPPPVGDMTGA